VAVRREKCLSPLFPWFLLVDKRDGSDPPMNVEKGHVHLVYLPLVFDRF